MTFVTQLRRCFLQQARIRRSWQSRLGHSSVRQTLDTYSHVAPTMQATATAKLSQLLFPALRIVKDDAAV
jgi:hypothetical protein